MMKHGWRIDDGGLWTDIIGMVLGPALFFRAAVHVVVAAGLDLDPRLSDGTDVTVASPVPSLRGHDNELAARMTTALIALVFGLMYAVPDVAGIASIATGWLTLNWAVMVCDPAAGGFLAARRRTRATTAEPAGD